MEFYGGAIVFEGFEMQELEGYWVLMEILGHPDS
jgi:hypothetical protein